MVDDGAIRLTNLGSAQSMFASNVTTTIISACIVSYRDSLCRGRDLVLGAW